MPNCFLYSENHAFFRESMPFIHAFFRESMPFITASGMLWC